MPNDTLAATGQVMPRRLFLAAGPAAAVFATLHSTTAKAFAPGSDARIFALVAEGKHWWAQLALCMDLAENPATEEEGEKKLQEAHNNYNAPFEEMLTIPPQTSAGARAKLEWVKKDCEGISLPDEHVAMLIESLLASPLLKGGA